MSNQYRLSSYTLFVFVLSFLAASSFFLPIERMLSPEEYEYSPIIQVYRPGRQDNDEILHVDPHSVLRRSPTIYPRSNRKSWFRVATYHYFKPTGSEENGMSDQLMRWG